MSRTTRRANRSEADLSQVPVPPPDGWTLMEAAEALCPDEAELFKQGGAALEAVLRAEMGQWAKFNLPLFPDGWLSRRLVAALCKRPDLQLTLRDLTQGIHAPRSSLQHDLLLAAAKADNGHSGERLRLQFYFHRNAARVVYDLAKRPRNLPDIVELTEVRIEASSGAGAMIARPMTPESPAIGEGNATKLEFSQARCRAWFRLRIDGWPKDKPPPSGAECLAAARAHFAGSIPRDALRAIRREAVPLEWQKPGPRGPRN